MCESERFFEKVEGDGVEENAGTMMMSKSIRCSELLTELKASISELPASSANEKFRHIEVVKLSEDRALISFHNQPPALKKKTTIARLSTAMSTSLSIDCGKLGLEQGGDSGISSPESPMVSPVVKSKQCPSRQYSSQANVVFRQRAVSETVGRGILKLAAISEISPRKKTVSFSEMNQTLVFNPQCGLDEQAARRRKNEKKRLQKQRKSEEHMLEAQQQSFDDGIDEGTGLEADIDRKVGGKRSARQDSGFVSDEEAEAI